MSIALLGPAAIVGGTGSFGFRLPSGGSVVERLQDVEGSEAAPTTHAGGMK